LVFALVPDVEGWSKDEKELARQIIAAKLCGDERRYLRLLQRHKRLREAIIKIGS
jgi:hypothetical protein